MARRCGSCGEVAGECACTLQADSGSLTASVRGAGTPINPYLLAGYGYQVRNVRHPRYGATGGGVFYVESGALKYRGNLGTVTTIAPA